MAEVAPELIQALATLRANVRSDETSEAVAQAIVVLDNAGVFAAIDAAADECGCPELSARTGLHLLGCPKTPAQDDMPPQELEQAREAGLWGDRGYTGKSVHA